MSIFSIILEKTLPRFLASGVVNQGVGVVIHRFEELPHLWLSNV